MSDIKLGISPIGWSNDDLLELGGDTPLETFLKEAREIGFSGVELGNKFPKDKKDLKAVLQEYDLELAGGWFSGNLLVNSLMEEQERLRDDSIITAQISCMPSVQIPFRANLSLLVKSRFWI